MNMPAPVTWQVTTQQSTTGRLPDGGFGPVWQIGYKTSTGATGYVWLPPAQAQDIDQVRAAIQAEVDGVAARHVLTG